MIPPTTRSPFLHWLATLFFALAAAGFALGCWAYSRQTATLLKTLAARDHDREELKGLVAHLAAEREVRGGNGPAWDGRIHDDAPAYLASQRLLSTIVARLELMPDVAKAKWNAGKPIEDPEREKALLDGMESLAAANHLDEKLVRSLFEDQIEAAKLVQQSLFDEWKENEPPRFEAIPDLLTEQRPKIDRATQELLLAFVIHQFVGTESERSGYLQFLAKERLASEPADGPTARALRTLFAATGPAEVPVPSDE